MKKLSLFLILLLALSAMLWADTAGHSQSVEDFLEEFSGDE